MRMGRKAVGLKIGVLKKARLPKQRLFPFIIIPFQPPIGFAFSEKSVDFRRKGGVENEIKANQSVKSV